MALNRVAINRRGVAGGKFIGHVQRGPHRCKVFAFDNTYFKTIALKVIYPGRTASTPGCFIDGNGLRICRARQTARDEKPSGKRKKGGGQGAKNPF